MRSTQQGVLLVWDKRVFEKFDCVVGLFSVNVLLKRVVDDFVWACSGVYEPNEDNLRGALWEELSSMHSRWNAAWCVLEDFNTIRYSSERFGCEAFSPAMFVFSDFIEANYLVDLPLEGASFTLFRDSGSVCMSRIDRTLASVDWIDHFGNVSQRVLPRVVFDHCPLLVVGGSVNKGRSAFKFENMWLKKRVL